MTPGIPGRRPGTAGRPYEELLAAGPPAGRPAPDPVAPPAVAGPEVTVVRPGRVPPPPLPAGRTRRRPPRRLRYGVAYRTALAVFFLGGAAGVVGLLTVEGVMGEAEHVVPVGTATTVEVPPSSERWLWLPEERDVRCAATDGVGSTLTPQNVLWRFSHDDHESTFSIPTGDGTVTLDCQAADGDGGTVVVTDPVASDLIPWYQGMLVLTLAAPVLGVLVAAGTGVVQVVTGVRRVRRRRADRPG